MEIIGKKCIGLQWHVHLRQICLRQAVATMRRTILNWSVNGVCRQRKSALRDRHPNKAQTKEITFIIVGERGKVNENENN